MYNDTHLNILISYAYMYGQENFLNYVKEQTCRGTVNLMIDSGAFTKHNSKQSMQHVNVADYCKFLQEWKNYCEKYVMLDVVGNAVQSKINYNTMLDCGLNPMFVATMFDKDYDGIRKAVERNHDICVAGGVTTKGDWMIKRFQDIWRQTDGKAWMHGLGYFTFPNMLKLNLRSVDASSWKTAAARFGQAIFFSLEEKRTYRIWRLDVAKGKIKLPTAVRIQLQRLNITPKMFFDEELQRGEDSVCSFINLYNNISLQKYCKRYGLEYFLAVGSLSDLRRIVYVSNNIGNITYPKYLKEFGKEVEA